MEGKLFLRWNNSALWFLLDHLSESKFYNAISLKLVDISLHPDTLFLFSPTNHCPCSLPLCVKINFSLVRVRFPGENG